jgi:sulfatase maturation enzyme AslB (radical SAM superfamily)
MNNYFCVLPFFSYEASNFNGKNTYCCRLAPGTNIKQVQESINNQQRSPACNTCWNLEDRGQTSERQIHNRSFDFYLDRDLELIEQDALKEGHKSKIIKLTTSNLCNGTCVTCGSDHSSAWASLENKKINYRVADTDQLDIDWAQIVQLSFVGGEPLLEKKNFVILQKLIELNNTKCFVSIVTNGSIELSQSQLDILSKFTNLNICVSIDGTDKVFDYIRYPLSWNHLIFNLEKFKKIAQHVSVSCMISNLNILHYTKIVNFFKSQNINYLCKQIEWPSYFSPGNLTTEFKQKVLSQNSEYHDQVESFLRCGHSTPRSLMDFWKEIDRQDQLKNINIKDYLTDLWSTRI